MDMLSASFINEEFQMLCDLQCIQFKAVLKEKNLFTSYMDI